jgi:hypothetical protein
MINKVILKVKGGIKKASLVCEDRVNGYIEKVRDFAKNEVVKIPWSCSFASTPVKFHRIKMSINSDAGIRENIDDEEEAALIKFENGETIIHILTIYKTAIEDYKSAWTTVHYATASGAAGGTGFILIGVFIAFYCCYKCKGSSLAPTAPMMDLVMAEKDKILAPDVRRMEDFPYHDRVYPALTYAGLQDRSLIYPSPDE